MKGHYIDGPYGQVHFHSWNLESSSRPIVCLPPSPFSSLAYVTLAPLLAEQRPVIAIDYPGYGNSAACPEPATIAQYAQAVAAVLEIFADRDSADLLGFHTGCLVAVETSLAAPDMVNQLLLIDCPYFDEAKQKDLLAMMGQPVELDKELGMLQQAWDFCVAKRLEHIPLNRAYDMFVDHIRTGVNTNQAFAAAFTYPCKERFELVKSPSTVFATKAGLYQQSIDTAHTIPSAKLRELVEIETAVLEQAAQIIADEISRTQS